MSNDVLTSIKTNEAPAPQMEMTKERVVIPGDTKVEPPFLDYEKMEGKPFLVDYYELGNLWDRRDMYSNAFTDEVDGINKYLTYAISKGDISNSVEGVTNELKRIEKMINVRPDQRKSMRIGLVKEYVDFLMKSEYVKKESAKYGMI